MADYMTKEQRSELMSRVRSSDTKPEWILRCGLHRLGFRYRLKNAALPGSPDIVFPKYGAAIFVHGCYWHRHPGCKHASIPKTNVEFWTKKFADNCSRDMRNAKALKEMGWRVKIVWECELENLTTETIKHIAKWIRNQSECSQNYTNKMKGVIGRRDLLATAEKKVKSRIQRYEKKDD